MPDKKSVAGKCWPYISSELPYKTRNKRAKNKVTVQVLWEKKSIHHMKFHCMKLSKILREVQDFFSDEQMIRI